MGATLWEKVSFYWSLGISVKLYSPRSRLWPGPFPGTGLEACPLPTFRTVMPTFRLPHSAATILERGTTLLLSCGQNSALGLWRSLVPALYSPRSPDPLSCKLVVLPLLLPRGQRAPCKSPERAVNDRQSTCFGFPFKTLAVCDVPTGKVETGTFAFDSWPSLPFSVVSPL